MTHSANFKYNRIKVVQEREYLYFFCNREIFAKNVNQYRLIKNNFNSYIMCNGKGIICTKDTVSEVDIKRY